jgi:hypothetical protein
MIGYFISIIIFYLLNGITVYIIFLFDKKISIKETNKFWKKYLRGHYRGIDLFCFVPDFN